MTQIFQIDEETAPYFQYLTFPNYAHLLENFQPEEYFAVGALNEEHEPIGLLLTSRTDVENEPHEILSISVDEEHQNRGIATKMIQYMQKLVLPTICPVLRGDYPDDLPHVEALERLIQKTGFRYEGEELLSLRGAIRVGMEIVPQVRDLPDGLTFREWSSRTESDMNQIIEYVRNYEVTGAHTPFSDMGIPIHEPTSVLLCHGDEIIGWMVNHEVQENVIRYSRLFIAPEWRKQRLGVHCFFESMTRQHTLDPDSVAVFAADSNNHPMLAVIEYFKHHPDVRFSRFRRVLWYANSNIT